MSQHARVLPRYRQLREAGLALNSRLVKTLSPNAIEKGGRRLGLFRGNVLTLETEDQAAPLMDFCLHDVRDQGVNAIERYLANSPPSPGSDELILLEALRQARFVVLVVEVIEAGVGVQVRDLLRDEPAFLVDIGLGQSAEPGLILATRVIAPEGILMTTGAALPMGVLPPAARSRFLEGVKSVLRKKDCRDLSPREAGELAASVIRESLKLGAAQHIQYREPVRGQNAGLRSNASPRRPTVGRNDRCPCGSGKKFKHCCGASR